MLKLVMALALALGGCAVSDAKSNQLVSVEIAFDFLNKSITSNLALGSDCEESRRLAKFLGTRLTVEDCGADNDAGGLFVSEILPLKIFDEVLSVEAGNYSFTGQKHRALFVDMLSTLRLEALLNHFGIPKLPINIGNLHRHPCLMSNGAADVFELNMAPNIIHCLANPEMIRLDCRRQPRPLCTDRDIIGFFHGIRRLTGILNGFPGKAHLRPNKKGAKGGDEERQRGSDEHPHGPHGHAFLRLQVSKFVWVVLGSLGLCLCYSGFALSGQLFDRKRDRLTILASLLASLGAFVAAFAFAAWLSY